MELQSPVRAQACWPRSRLVSGGLSPPSRHLCSPGSVSSCVHHGSGPAASGSPPSGRGKNLFPSWGPRSQAASLLPPCWRGPFPARDQQQPRQRRQEAKPLLMLFRGASVRPPVASRLFRAPGVPPPRVRSASRGGGAQIPVSGGGGGGCRQCALRRSPKRTLWLSLSPSPPEPSSLWAHRESDLYSAELLSTPPPLSSLGRVGSDCPRGGGGGGGSGCRPRLAAPGSVPAVPERRCRRHRRSPPPAALGPGWVELRCPRTSSHCSART